VIHYIMSNKIFIQIASYRDPQLYPTIKNAFENAKFPENLVFGICWQKDEKETLNEYENHPQVKLDIYPYQQSKGACWARNKLQQLYTDEQYTLQLDSHHRFVKHWDTVLINMYNQLREKGVEKPLITTYLPSYNPSKDPEERCMCPWEIVMKEKTNDKQVLFIPSYIHEHEKLTEPVVAKFYSAHFAFTTGEFVKEVPHDPELYFTGEEMSITVRAYTYGYDLFHPHILIAWHEYTRNYRTKHWDDDNEWWKKDLHSKQHYLSIFENDGKYGIGKKRTIQDYINFSRVDFLNFDEVTKKEPETKTEPETKSEPIQLNKEYKEIDETWRTWIEDNLKLNISRDAIKDILIKANFNPTSVNQEFDNISKKINYII
jgi:Glycosyltransferase (GlcNAc)